MKMVGQGDNLWNHVLQLRMCAAKTNTARNRRATRVARSSHPLRRLLGESCFFIPFLPATHSSGSRRARAMEMQ